MPAIRSWVFGQGEDCDVRIDDPYVSTHHCRITLAEDGSATVEDLGSTNGTWIRTGPKVLREWSLPGSRVYGKTRIEPGHIVRIGRTDLPWRGAP